MDVSTVIRQRLQDLDLEQRGLAAAARVTESYVSQLLTRKKAPPAPARTDIYEKMDRFLKLPPGQLAKVAEMQRREELKKELAGPPEPLFQEVRVLILRKCHPEKRDQLDAIFAKEAFGPLERLITQKLLDVTKGIAREELASENWLRIVARLNGRSYEQTRVTVLEFLDTDIFNLSAENCVGFMDPLIDSWDIDLATFGIEIVMNRRLTPGLARKFGFVEQAPGQPEEEPGLREFFSDAGLSADVTKEEIEFLKGLKFKARRPTPLYYYRELQNLRDPLHFRAAKPAEDGKSIARRKGDPGPALPAG